MKKILASMQMTWYKLFAFLKSPKDEKDPIQTQKYRFKALLSILVLDIIIAIILIQLIFLVETLGLVDLGSHKSMDLMEENPYLALFFGIIIAPIFEEIIFRTYIVERYSPIKIIAFFVGITGTHNRNNTYHRLKKYWEKYYKVVIYFSALLFAYIHITNYDINTDIWLFSPLLVSPQFVIGLFLAYIRVKFGLVWAILFHALHNIVFMLPVFLLI